MPGGRSISCLLMKIKLLTPTMQWTQKRDYLLPLFRESTDFFFMLTLIVTLSFATYLLKSMEQDSVFLGVKLILLAMIMLVGASILPILWCRAAQLGFTLILQNWCYIPIQQNLQVFCCKKSKFVSVLKEMMTSTKWLHCFLSQHELTLTWFNLIKSLIKPFYGILQICFLC